MNYDTQVGELKERKLQKLFFVMLKLISVYDLKVIIASSYVAT